MQRIASIAFVSLFLAVVVFIAMPDKYLAATVLRISDGDTFTVETGFKDQLRIRVYGIDAPETDQAHGPEATRKLQSIMPVGSKVRLRIIDIDRYGRAVALVKLPSGAIVEEVMLLTGSAWVYTKYCKIPECNAWRDIEERAMLEEKGLWADIDPLEPWEWRYNQRNKEPSTSEIKKLNQFSP